MTKSGESQSFSDSLKDIAMIPFNFSFKENHMWYIYLLIGLYLYMPFFLTSSLKKCSFYN